MPSDRLLESPQLGLDLGRDEDVLALPVQGGIHLPADGRRTATCVTARQRGCATDNTSSRIRAW
jgi:hypothetical protein